MDSSDIKNNGVFCMHPWVTQIKNPLGDVRLCPVKNNYYEKNADLDFAWNSPQLTQVRHNMINGVKTEEHCNSCYLLDEQGIPSERTKSLKDVPDEKIQQLLDSTTSRGAVNIYPEHLGLSLDVECESLCVQCNRMNSTKWREMTPFLIENSDHRVIKADFRTRYVFDDDAYLWSDSDSDFWPKFWEFVPNVKNLVISGGEPFDSIKVKRLIAELSTKPFAENLTLTINTTGKYIPNEMWDMFAKFKNTVLQFSIDGVGEKAEWLRYPLKWKDFESNVNKADELNIGYEFIANIHALNLAYIPEIYEWLWSLKLNNLCPHPISYTFNHRPNYLDVRFLEQETKQFINQRLWDFYGQHNTKFEESYFGSMMGCLDFMWQHRDSRKNYLIKDYITTMDKTRETKFQDIFPELHECL